MLGQKLEVINKRYKQETAVKAINQTITWGTYLSELTSWRLVALKSNEIIILSFSQNFHYHCWEHNLGID